MVERSGVSHSALRFYETEGLLHPDRTDGGQRRFHRDELRRVAFIRIAQQLGLSLEQIRDALATLPEGRTPNARDWAVVSAAWRSLLDDRIAQMERLRDQLDSCIGCGCLSLTTCGLYNREDEAAALGPGPRWLIGERPART
ncbi:MAG: redox-sensitive transcriptional activator SoxR [Acidimicrobiia bacterium]|nr:redox-sensitive transcriptional activator SoxR [Acidimicrobiia bacterium]